MKVEHTENLQINKYVFTWLNQLPRHSPEPQDLIFTLTLLSLLL